MKMPAAEWVSLQPRWRVQCERGCSSRLLSDLPTVHRGSGSHLTRVLYVMSLVTPVCRWPGYDHWIAGWSAREADPLKDQNRMKGTLGQHGQNQGPDIWSGARCASEVWQRPLRRVSQGYRHKLHVCGSCSSWIHTKCSGILLLSEAWSGLQVEKVYWTGQTNIWQSNDGGHSGSGEALGDAILLLPCGLLILGWRLGTRYYRKMPCRMEQIQRVAARPHSLSFPIASRARCVRSVMLHASATWAATLFDLVVYNAMTPLWFAGCAGSPHRTKSARRIAWKGYSLTIWQRYSAPADSEGTAM